MKQDLFPIDYEKLGLKETKRSETCILYEEIEEENAGQMLVCSLFPGIEIYYIHYNTTKDFSAKFVLKNYMEISYSYEGVYEFELRDNRCVYIGEGDLMAFCNIFESLSSRFPLKVFNGFGLMIDLYTASTVMERYFNELSIDIKKIADTLCGKDNILIMKSNGNIREILDNIYLADPNQQLGYIKLKILELLHILSNEDMNTMKYKCNYYEKDIIFKVKHVKEHLSAELSKHITIEELAKEHQLTQTMLKNCFKSIYGIPPYEYLKKLRMNYAASLLKNKAYSISEIAGKVGYQNASKFSSAFKDIMGMTPREYRLQIK